jgi:hypothetical protein
MAREISFFRPRSIACILTVAAGLIIAPLRVHAQAGALPPGTPQTAPTTVQGTPAPSPADPQPTAVSTQPVVSGTPTSDMLGPIDTPIDYAQYGSPPFSGTYKGRYHAVYSPGTKPQTGTLTLTITPGGAVTGSIHADSGGLDGTVGGTLSTNGHVSLAFTFTAGVSGTIDGLIGLTPKGHLTSTLTQSFGATPSGTMDWEAGKS